MSSNTILNMIKSYSNKSNNKQLSLKRNIRNTAIYSNEMCRDFIKIYNCKTVKDCNKLALESMNNIRALEYLIRTNNVDYRNRRIRISNMKKFSLEAANYLYSLEEENKGENWFKKTLNWLKKIFMQLGSWIAAKWKALLTKLGIMKKEVSNKIYKNFKPENFQNMDAQISVLPVTIELDKLDSLAVADGIKEFEENFQKSIDSLSQLLNKLRSNGFGTAEELEEELSKALGEISLGIDDDFTPENIAKMIYMLAFDTEQFPKKVTMTVGEYLKCKAGERPAALEALNEKSLDFTKNGKKIVEKSMETIKLLIQSIDNLLKEKESSFSLEGSYKSLVELMNKAKLCCSNGIILYDIVLRVMTSVQMDIATAIKAGMTK